MLTWPNAANTLHMYPLLYSEGTTWQGLAKFIHFLQHRHTDLKWRKLWYHLRLPNDFSNTTFLVHFPLFGKAGPAMAPRLRCPALLSSRRLCGDWSMRRDKSWGVKDERRHTGITPTVLIGKGILSVRDCTAVYWMPNFVLFLSIGKWFRSVAVVLVFPSPRENCLSKNTIRNKESQGTRWRR
mgnify:CR=1 FL=1